MNLLLFFDFVRFSSCPLAFSWLEWITTKAFEDNFQSCFVFVLPTTTCTSSRRQLDNDGQKKCPFELRSSDKWIWNNLRERRQDFCIHHCGRKSLTIEQKTKRLHFEQLVVSSQGGKKNKIFFMLEMISFSPWNFKNKFAYFLQLSHRIKLEMLSNDIQLLVLRETFATFYYLKMTPGQNLDTKERTSTVVSC